MMIILPAILFSRADKGTGRQIAIRLPGTQPGQADSAVSVDNCRACHPQQVREWRQSAMAYAPRDPLFNALLAVTTKHTINLGLEVGEYCLRCHSPSGWLAGRSHELSVQALYGSDLDGVHCDFCHRSVDPLSPDTTIAIVGGRVPGYGNGMYVVQTRNYPTRGSRGLQNVLGHCQRGTIADEFYRSSEFCGVCHDVSNPYLSTDPWNTPPHLQVPVERTYSEWKLSWYATRGEAGTCQSCHMPRYAGHASNLPGTPYRLNVAGHDFSGGNTFGLKAIGMMWEGVDVNLLAEGVTRSVAMLRQSARLEVAAGTVGDSVVALVRITNMTGHKFPTGFPEGRVAWISVTGKNQGGQVVFESGRYDSLEGRVMDDAQLKAYRTVRGISFSLAAQLGLTPGPSLQAALCDTVFFDNRIPPRGFVREAFRQHCAEPVSCTYDDGQYWDITAYVMAADVTTVEVTLYYQLVDKEFVEFLRQENIGNPYDWNSWGEKVYQAWRNEGGPVAVAYQRVSVPDRPPVLPPFVESDKPVEIRLAQNYPNPFNARTTIEYWISEPGYTTLTVYNILGQIQETVVAADLEAGLHTAYLDAAEYASGVYLYVVSIGRSVSSKTMLVIR